MLFCLGDSFFLGKEGPLDNPFLIKANFKVIFGLDAPMGPSKSREINELQYNDVVGGKTLFASTLASCRTN